MERARLVDSVTAEVLKRLAAAPVPALGIAVGGPWPGWKTYTPQISALEQQRALIVRLEPWAMVRLAQGHGIDASEQFLLEMLLLGRSVALAPEALRYHHYRDTAPKALYQQYIASEKALLAMGVRPLVKLAPQPSAKKCLLTETDVQSLIAQGESVLSLSARTIITPLAMDALKAAQITVLREEGEAKRWN